MRVSVELEGNLLSDRFGKYASEADRLEGFPVRSFPIHIEEVPEGAASLALAFIDFDAIPVGGFCWIHWLACACTQGANSNWSPMAHGSLNPAVFNRYCGPQPPDKTHVYTLVVYALDCKLGLSEGYYLNEFRRAIEGHVLAKSVVELPSRA